MSAGQADGTAALAAAAALEEAQQQQQDVAEQQQQNGAAATEDRSCKRLDQEGEQQQQQQQQQESLSERSPQEPQKHRLQPNPKHKKPQQQQQEEEEQQEQQQVYLLPHKAPPVEVKLFVGRVPQSVEADQLRRLFADFGEVRDCSIIRDKATLKHRNSAFVRMSSLCFADAAIRGLHGLRSLEAGAPPLAVKYASGEAARLGLSAAAADGGIDKAKLFVGSIPRTATEEELLGFFAAYGSVDEVFVIRDSTSGQGRGCAFVKYKYKEEALYAIRCLSGIYTFPGCSRPVDVRFAETKTKQQQQQQLQQQQQRLSPMAAAAAAAAKNYNPRQAGPWREYFTSDCQPYYHNEVENLTTWERPPEFDSLAASPWVGAEPTGPPGANVFVFHIPREWGRQQLLQAFGGFGAIVSCHVAVDRESGRNKGFGFVSFSTTAAAAAAVNAMNDCLVSNKRLNVSIKKGEERHAALHLLSPAASQQSSKHHRQQLQQQHQQHQQQQHQQQYCVQQPYAPVHQPHPEETAPSAECSMQLPAYASQSQQHFP